MKAARLTVGFGIVLLAGCATVREYPRCYLFRAPAQVDVAAANAATSEVLSKFVSRSDFSVTKDGAVVKALVVVHRDIAKAWPSTGCVNLRRPAPWTAEIVDKRIVADCQDYVEDLGRRELADPPTQTRAAIADRYVTFECH